MPIDPISRRLLDGAGLVPVGKGRGPVVLMYHGLHAGRDDDGWKWSLSAARFRQHLQVLVDWGWVTLAADDLVFDDSIPPRAVVITFDDGYKDNLDLAVPLLQEFGMTATWFVVSRGLGGLAPWRDSSPRRRPLLSPADLREMKRMGFGVGAHSQTHRDLTQLKGQEIKAEVEGSKRDLEELLGEAVESFAYPFGASNEACITAVSRAGYARAFTCDAGWFGSERHPFKIRRVAVERADTGSRFARKLAFADARVGWGRTAQYLARRVFSRVRGVS